MLSRLILVIVIIFFSNNIVNGETKCFDNSLLVRYTKKVPKCGDIYQNAIEVIPDYYVNSQEDSLKIILDLLYYYCGPNFDGGRLPILLAIRSKTFNDSLISPSFFTKFKRARERYDLIYEKYYGDDYVDAKYEKFTINLADSLSNVVDTNSIEYLLTLFYSKKFNSFFHKLKTNNSFSDSKLKEYFEKEYDYLKRVAQVRLEYYMGTWIPYGENDVLGIHPIVGVKIGVKKWKFILDFYFDFKFGKTSEYYYIQQKDSLYKTDHFSDAALGLNFGFEVFRNLKNEVDANIKIGLDSFEAVKDNKSAESESINISSPNFGFGIQYRYYLKKKGIGYVGFEGMYNFLQYENDVGVGSDLSGDAITFNISIGFNSPLISNRTLENVGYWIK